MPAIAIAVFLAASSLRASEGLPLEGLPALREAARGGHLPTGLALAPVALVAVFIVGSGRCGSTMRAAARSSWRPAAGARGTRRS